MFEARLCRVVVKIKISLNFSDLSELPIFGNNYGYRAWEGGWGNPRVC
jgi:hypothetical protein